MRKIVTVGKISEVDFDSLLPKKTPKGISRKNLLKLTVASVTFVAAVALLNDHTMAATVTQAVTANSAPYGDVQALKPLLSFVDWLIHLIRIVISTIMGLMSSYAGFLFTTDRKDEAKRILTNQAIGGFWIMFGPMLANFFITKLGTFL